MHVLCSLSTVKVATAVLSLCMLRTSAATVVMPGHSLPKNLAKRLPLTDLCNQSAHGGSMPAAHHPGITASHAGPNLTVLSAGAQHEA